MSSKGDKSKTHPGDMDYTTKRGDKDFHRKGHNVKGKDGRKPFKAPRHQDLGRGAGKGDMAEQKKSRPRFLHHTEHKPMPHHTKKLGVSRSLPKGRGIAGWRVRNGLAPRTFSGYDGAGI